MMLQRFTTLLLLIPCLALGEDRYRASFSENLDEVEVEACFDGPAPDHLFRNEDISTFASGIKWNKREITNWSRWGRAKLPDLPQDACIHWTVDLAAAIAGGDYRLAMKMDDGIISSGNLWFWRDGDERQILLQIDLPNGMSVSAPWQAEESQGTQLLFRPQPTPASWSSRIAIGHFPILEVTLPGGRLQVATMNTTEQQSASLASWIQTTAESVALVSGQFPQANAQILIIGIGPRDTPIPWAHVLRGGGMAAEFFVDETRPIDEFAQDWKAAHELSHMLLPYVSSKDRWLSEGLATYYENILRSRQGSITEEQAWLNLHNGFQRGQAATDGGSLASATRSGRAATMRVYWSGAAMMLMADTQIRALSGGKQSLDKTLSALQECCLEQNKTWTARELFGRMDLLNGNGVFMNLYEEHVSAEEFPDMSDTYEQLGLLMDAGTVTMNEEAPGSHIRYRIMNPTADGRNAQSRRRSSAWN